MTARRKKGRLGLFWRYTNNTSTADTNSEKAGAEPNKTLLEATYFVYQTVLGATRQMQLRASWLLAVTVTATGFCWYNKLYLAAFIFSVVFWFMIFATWPYKSKVMLEEIPIVYNRSKDESFDLAEDIFKSFWEKPNEVSVIESLSKDIKRRTWCYFTGVACFGLGYLVTIIQTLERIRP